MREGALYNNLLSIVQDWNKNPEEYYEIHIAYANREDGRLIRPQQDEKLTMDAYFETLIITNEKAGSKQIIPVNQIGFVEVLKKTPKQLQDLKEKMEQGSTYKRSINVVRLINRKPVLFTIEGCFPYEIAIPEADAILAKESQKFMERIEIKDI